MSRVQDQLEKIQNNDRIGQDNASGDMRLDPFIHQQPPRLWKRIKAILTFDRTVIVGFILIAAFVLTYRAAVYQRGEEKLGAHAAGELPLKKADRSARVVEPVTDMKSVSGAIAVTLPVNDQKAIPPQAVETSAKEVALKAAAEIRMDKPKVQAEPVKPYFTIQLATYDKRDRAQNELSWLKHHGLDGVVVEGNKKYLLSIGKFADKKTAGKKMKSIFTGDFKKRYPDSYVRYVKD